MNRGDLLKKVPILANPAAVTTARVRASIFSRHEITNGIEKQAAAPLAAQRSSFWSGLVMAGHVSTVAYAGLDRLNA
jgi:hypothetical protein